MKSIQALRERLNARASAVRQLVEDHNDNWNKDHQANYDAGMAEVEDLKGQITRMEAANEVLADDKVNNQIADAAGRRAGGGKAGEQAHALYSKFLRQGESAITAEEWRQIRATMSTTTTTEGGFTMQTEVARMVIDQLKAFGGMRAVAEVLVTESGNPMNFPGSDGTAEEGEIIAENQPATGADVAFTSVGLNVFKFSSKVVTIPFELLQDSQIDVEAFTRRRLTTRLGRITNKKFTIGTGSGEPFGVIPRASLGKTGTTGQTTTVIFDDLVDLVHSVDPAYRASPGVRFMMHDLSLRTVRKLKDSQGRPIFLPGYDGLAGPMPDMVLGYQVQVNQDVATMAANAKSIAFGDFKQYYVRDAMQITLFRFADSAYAKNGQVGFLMWHRSGGNLLDSSAVKYYANSAT